MFTVKQGYIELICGSMFSGKSEELIRRVKQATYANLKVQVFKPQIDFRYDLESVVSHNGNKVTAIPVASAADIVEKLADDVDIIAIDEVQFFDEEIIELTNELATKGKRVILAGLDTNFRGEPFGIVPALMALSESVTKLNAICPICHAPASRTQRLINGEPVSYYDPIILIGESEAYEPRCRHHHVVPQSPNK